MKDFKKEQKRIFLEGIQRYKTKGVSVLIDGKDFGPDDYEKLVGIRENGSFYMGDYVESEPGKLIEIRFDKVYYK